MAGAAKHPPFSFGAIFILVRVPLEFVGWPIGFDAYTLAEWRGIARDYFNYFFVALFPRSDTLLQMKVLIIHHLETMWDNGYKMFGTSFDELQERFIDWLNENHYDRVILTRFEDWRIDETYFPELAEKISVVHEYGYGWEREELENNPDEFTEGGNHSGAVWLAGWMRELSGCDVSISGAFDGECVEDLEIALRAIGIDFKRLENLIVG